MHTVAMASLEFFPLATKVYHSQTFLHSRFCQVILTQIPIETHVKMASKTVIRTITCRSVAANRMCICHFSGILAVYFIHKLPMKSTRKASSVKETLVFYEN